jgi:hypothetical protein
LFDIDLLCTLSRGPKRLSRNRIRNGRLGENARTATPQYTCSKDGKRIGLVNRTGIAIHHTTMSPLFLAVAFIFDKCLAFMVNAALPRCAALTLRSCYP